MFRTLPFLLPFLITLTITHTSQAIQKIADFGTIKGKYYVTQELQEHYNAELQQYKLKINVPKALKPIEATKTLQVVNDINKHELDIEDQLRKRRKAQFTTTQDGKDIKILSKLTAVEAQKQCQTIHGKPLDFINTKTLESIKSYIQQTNIQLEEVWQAMVLSKERIPIFINSFKQVPKFWENSPNSLAYEPSITVEDQNKCGFLNLKEQKFGTADCNSEKKALICELLPTETSISRRRVSHVLFDLLLLEAIQLNKAWEGLKSKVPIIDVIPDQTEYTEMLIFPNLHQTIINNLIQKPPKAMATNLFEQMCGYLNKILTRTRKFIEDTSNNSLQQIAPYLSGKKGDSKTQTNLIEDIFKSRDIQTKIFQANEDLFIQITVGKTTKEANSFQLFGLIINGNKPEYEGQAFELENTCVKQLPTATNYQLTPSTSTIIPCCNHHVLNKADQCEEISARTTRHQPWVAMVERDSYLFVSAKKLRVTSNSCQNINLLLDGSFVIKINSQEIGCDLRVDDFQLKTRGSITILKYTGINELKPVDYKQHQGYLPSTDLNEYILPITVVIGTAATIIGTMITLYLTISKRAERRRRRELRVTNVRATEVPLQSILRERSGPSRRPSTTSDSSDSEE